MNIEDSVRNTNSWHWLCLTVVVAAAASVFIPTYGWRDVLAYRDKTLATREKRTQAKLQETRGLCAIDREALNRQTDAAKSATAKAKADFARYGMEELPSGVKAVFAAQSRVGEALNSRKLRIVSTEAKVGERPAATPQPARSAASASVVKRQTTAVNHGFKIDTLDYKVVGDFRNMFMFFVAETYKKPNYSFRDIAVSVGETGMDLSFALQVCYR